MKDNRKPLSYLAVLGPLDIQGVRSAAQTLRIGRRILLVESTASTSDEVWNLVETQGLQADGTVMFAEHQTRGRGRLGRRWESPRGASLMMSFALLEQFPISSREVPPSLQVSETLKPRGPKPAARCAEMSSALEPAGKQSGQCISLGVPAAATMAIRRVAGIDCRIKWPNDLVVAGRKLGGILVEARRLDSGTVAFVVGIGINCLQQAGHFREAHLPEATSLDMECSRAIHREPLAIELIRELDLRFRWGFSTERVAIAEEWRRCAIPAGSAVNMASGGRVFPGWIVDVDPCGDLVVRLHDGSIRVFSSMTSSMECIAEEKECGDDAPTRRVRVE